MAIFALALTIMFAAIFKGFSGTWPNETFNDPIKYATSFTLTFRGYPFIYSEGINNPTWYLCVLIQCYLIYYIVHYIFSKLLNKRNDKTKTICLSVFFLLIVVIFTILKITGVLPDFMQDSSRGYISFFFGYLITAFFKNDNLKKWFFMIPLVLSIPLLIFLREYYYWWLLFFVYPSLLIFAYTFPLKNNCFIRTLAAISFETYLLHFPLELAFDVLLLKIDNFNHSAFSIIIFLIIVWIFSTAVYFLVERNVSKAIRKVVHH